MEDQNLSKSAELLPLLPSTDTLLRSEKARRLASETGAKHLTVLARSVIETLRREILENALNFPEASREVIFGEAERRLEQAWQTEKNTGLQKVINATGVIIHTNLGRAPLSEKARKAVAEEASQYCNLEYNLETGRRGKRGARVEHLLAGLTGAEAALVVNNCAAACFLVLKSLAAGGEVIISRGELVEIGGDFRIPDVMMQSGAMIREVGTTNRTRLSDYERAINENTRLLLKVHQSNYRIIGFSTTPSVAELSDLAHKYQILLYEDAGSGAMFDFTEYGLTNEPVISRSIVAGADVVTFSGDKLLGGPQAGLLVGRREVIEKIRRHPLYRAMRVDKLIYAALEATLEAFRKENFWQEIPVLHMLSKSYAEMMTRTAAFADKLRETLGENSPLKFEVIESNSVIGGGAAPEAQLVTAVLALQHERFSASGLEQKLRFSRPPVITRILEDKVLLDLRTVDEIDDNKLLAILTTI